MIEDLENLKQRIDALEAHFHHFVKEWYGIDLSTMTLEEREEVVKKYKEMTSAGD